MAALQSSAIRSDSSVHPTALITATDMAVILSIRVFASVSSGCGSAVGLRDNALGALFRVPFSQLAYTMILVFKRCSHGFWISSNLWLFKIGMRGWWSVTTGPARKMSHLVVMAHATANSSSSMIAYWLSESDKNRDPAWISDHVLPVFCWRTMPRPWWLASVQRQVSFPGSKYDRMMMLLTVLTIYLKRY